MPTAKVRIGNDVRLVWALYSADQPLSFDNCSEIEVELYCSRKQLTIKPDYTISGNKIIILFPASSQQTIGIWDARLRYKQPSMADPDTLLTYTHNTCAVFELVECSSEANDIGTDYVDEQGNRITISSVYISSSLDRITSADEWILVQAKDYTDQREQIIRQDFAAADQVILNSAKAYTDEREEVIRQDFAQADTVVLHEAQAYADQGDSTTLANAQSYTSQREESIRTDFAAADQYVLSQAKEYADTVKDWNDEDNRKKIWTGSQDEYDALPTKDPNTIYLTDDHAVTVTPTSLSFYVDQTSRTLTINCEANDQWVVTPELPDDWQVSPLSGTGPGTITVTATANSTSTPRNGSLSISIGGLSIHVPCHQPGIPERDTFHLILNDVSHDQGIVRVMTRDGEPVQDYLEINGVAGGKDLPETPWSILMLPGNTDGQTSVGGAIDSARILSVNKDYTGSYKGEIADYTWDNF